MLKCIKRGLLFLGSCPPGWLSRAADSGTGYNCYFLTPYSNYSLTYTKSEASDYCTNQAVSATAVPALLSVSTQSEKVGFDKILTGLAF